MFGKRAVIRPGRKTPPAVVGENAGLDDQFSQGHRAEVSDVFRRIGLDVRVQQVPHIRFERFDVEFFAGMPLDRCSDVRMELAFAFQRYRLRI